MKKAALIPVLLLIFACAQWRVTSLQPNTILTIPNGTGPGEVLIKTDEFALKSMSVTLSYHNDRILVADNESGRLQVLRRNGDVELIIGSPDNIDTEKFRHTEFNFGSIGQTFMDRMGRIYIQNRLTRPDERGVSRELSSSYILIFDPEGRLKHTLGRTGSPDIPFNHIETMQTDSRGRLHVISRSFESWNYYIFSGDKLEYSYNLSKIDLTEKEDGTEYSGIMENVRPAYNGETLIISASYYHDMRLKFHRVYKFSVEDQKIEKTLIRLPDPRNVFYNIIDDRYLYFWNVDRNNVRFMIADMEGTILNNIKLENMPPKSFYSKTFTDRSGNFYTYRITRNGIQFIKWE